MRPSHPQSHQRYPLTGILGTPGNVRLLRVLAEHGGPLGATRLSAEAGMSAVGARAALATLARHGAVKALGQGHAQLYHLNADHPFCEPLKALFKCERDRWGALLDELRGTFARRREVKAAWLYGSTARGVDGPGSDIDIALAVEGAEPAATADALRDDVRPLEDLYGVAISLVSLSSADILRRAADDAWWGEVVRDGLPLKASVPAQYLAHLQRASA